jgi:hypothetical protein
MPAMLLRFLTIIALALMPLGMGAMPAGAATGGDHRAMSMDAGHCDDQGPAKQATPTSMDCKAMCSAIPVATARAAPPLPMPRPVLKMALAARGDSIVPEFDPPPPKLG